MMTNFEADWPVIHSDFKQNVATVVVLAMRAKRQAI